MRREEIVIVEESESTDNPSINGRYHRFNHKLGSGAFKEVYKAFDTYSQIDVAWNSIDLSLINSTNERKKIFRECEMLRKLNHPNILKITDQWFNNKTDKLCFITNIVQDGSLSKFFRKRKVNLLRVKQISKQILNALVYLHNNGVIHRDIKCENIFIHGNTGKVVVGDLGLSCNIISARSIVGTPHWMAPELFKENYNELVDIWSFGMCVLELISSSIPFNECKGAFQVYQTIISGKKPESLKKINDASVKGFINICLNINPKMRPSAKELLEHPFFYCRNKDKILCSELMKPKKKYIEPVLSIEEKKEELIMQSILNPPKLNENKRKLKEDIVRIKKVTNNGNENIKIKLKIICNKFGKPMNVEFDFNYKIDIPSNVAMEMIAHLKLPIHFTNKIEKAIQKAVEKGKKQTNKQLQTNNDLNILEPSKTSLTSSVSSQLINQQKQNNNNVRKMVSDPMYSSPPMDTQIDYLTESDPPLLSMINNNNTRESIPIDNYNISISNNTQQLSLKSDINISQPISVGNTLNSRTNSITQQTEYGEYNNNPKSTTSIISINDYNNNILTNTKSISTSPIYQTKIIGKHTKSKSTPTINNDDGPLNTKTPLFNQSSSVLISDNNKQYETFTKVHIKMRIKTNNNSDKNNELDIDFDFNNNEIPEIIANQMINELNLPNTYKKEIINVINTAITNNNNITHSNIPSNSNVSLVESIYSNINDNINDNNNLKILSLPKSTTPPSSPPIISIVDHNNNNILTSSIYKPKVNETDDGNNGYNNNKPSIYSIKDNNNNNNTKNISTSPIYNPKVIDNTDNEDKIEPITLSDGLIALQSLNNNSSDIEIYKATLKLTLNELINEFTKRNKLYNKSEGKNGLARKLVDILKQELTQINNKPNNIPSPIINKKEQTPNSIFISKSTSIESTETSMKKQTQYLPSINTLRLPFELEELRLETPNNNIIFDNDTLNQINTKTLEFHNEYIEFIQRKYELLQLQYDTLETEYENNITKQIEIKIEYENNMKGKINKKRFELTNKFDEWLSDMEQIEQLKNRIIHKKSISIDSKILFPTFDKQLEFENDPRFIALMKSELNDFDKQKCKMKMENYRKQMINNYNKFIKSELYLNNQQPPKQEQEPFELELLSQLEHIFDERTADSTAFNEFMKSIPQNKIKSYLGTNAHGNGQNNSDQNGNGNNMNQNNNNTNNSGNKINNNSDEKDNKENKNNDENGKKDDEIMNDLCFKFGKCKHFNNCNDCSERMRYTKHLENIISIQSKHILKQSEYHTSFQSIIIDAIKHSIHKKNNKKKKKKIDNNRSEFEPIYKAENCIKITRKFTENVKNIIREPISNIYNWISKTISLQFNDGLINKHNNLQIINLDFHNKNNELLYGIIRSMDEKYNFKLWMDEKLYTQKELLINYNGLIIPKSSRNMLQFKIEMNQILNNKLNMKYMIEKCDWNRINIFKCVNNTQRMTLSITKRILCEKLLQNIQNRNGFDLIPILMFQNNKHWIENVCIIQIEANICIGISLKSDTNGTIEITGIHLNEMELQMKHELIGIQHKCNCFNQFKSVINDIYIGDPNTIINQMKTFKQKYNTITPVIYNLINAKYLNEYKSVQNDAIILMKYENGNLENDIFNNKSIIYSPLTCYSSPTNSYSSPEYLNLSGNGNMYDNMYNVKKLMNNNKSQSQSQRNDKF